MDERLKILMLEDSITDAEIVRRALKKEKLDFEFHLAMDKDSFLQALDRFTPDVILADNSLPQFSAREALEIVHEKALHIPFILVTGSVSEEFAAGIIKLGAHDYILKDRLTRLPAAIEAALKQQRMEKENQEALEETRRSNERFQTLSGATTDGVWDWDLVTDSIWWNDGLFILLGIDPALPIPDLPALTERIHPSDRDKMTTRLQRIRDNTISSWSDELRFLLEDGSYGTLLDRAYVLKDDSGKPVRAIGVFVNISEQKRLVTERRKIEEERLMYKIEQQKEVTRVILQTQEMERNALGRELHDNINQILASVYLKLGYYLEKTGNGADIIEGCRENLQKAIREARNLSHRMVMPPFSERSLQEELETLVENYSYKQKVQLEFGRIHEEIIPSAIKETLFRIVQEQLSNIYKHAKADKIVISVNNDDQSVWMNIDDNGVGFDLQQKRRGIGISNIFTRVESYNGTADLVSQPGKGCALSVKIPLPA